MKMLNKGVDQLARIVDKSPLLITVVFVPVALVLCMVLGTLTAYYMDGYELSRSAFVMLVAAIPLLIGYSDLRV